MNDDEPYRHFRTIDIDTYEKNQRKRTLSIILVITMIAAVIFGAINLFIYESQEPATVFFVASILCLPTLWLNLRDYYRPSGLIAAVLVFTMAHFNLADGAGIRDPGVVAYPIIILIASLLFGKRSIMIFTVTGIVSLVIVAVGGGNFSDDLVRLIIITVLLVVGAGATWAVLEKTENSIRRLKESDEYLRQALDQSHKHAQRIDGIIESVPEGVLLLNTNHQIILTNRTAQSFLAVLAPTHLQEEPLKQVGHFTVEELIRSAGEGWQEIVVGEPERIFEAALRPVQQVPAPYKNWVLVLRDATQERKQQESLQEQERLAVVGQLSTGIAHDFRNILSVISTYSQIVQKRPDLLKQKEYLSVIQDQVRDAARLIEQILDFGRRTIMQRRPLDAVVLMESTIKLLQRTLPSNIAIEFIYGPGSYVLNADKSRLQQALMNLAVNARDVMPDGGTLKFVLSKGDLPAGLVVDSEITALEWLSLQVSDTGEGIRPEDLPHIFEPFFTTKATMKGTGLGLAQVYGIVKQHEGEIVVESERGTGTTFSLYFPAISEKPLSPFSAGEGVAKIGREIHVLLVEDNVHTRQATEEMLKLLGCNVVSAENGQDALTLYRTQLDRIQLVISDIVMPEMSGVELYQELQSIAPQLKFLILTGYPLNNKAKELMEQGYVDWIQKPFQAEELAQKIETMMGVPLESP